LSGRNSGSDALGEKTAGKTRTGTGGDRDREGETDGKRNRAEGPKIGSEMVLSKGDAQQVAETCCSSLAMDWMSTSHLGLGFFSYKLPMQCWRTEQ